jgi:hypothetical protein
MFERSKALLHFVEDIDAAPKQDKHVDHANRVALVNEIIEAFGQ